MIDIRIHGVGRYELLQDVSVSVNGWNITVYKGFTWDGASIPKSLWSEVGCPIDYAVESLIHDALYRTHLLDRKSADKIFHRLLVQNGVSMVKAKAMYLAVRVGGEEAYSGANMKSHYRKYVMITPIDFNV